jgi:hypothetical protein
LIFNGDTTSSDTAIRLSGLFLSWRRRGMRTRSELPFSSWTTCTLFTLERRFKSAKVARGWSWTLEKGRGVCAQGLAQTAVNLDPLVLLVLTDHLPAHVRALVH